MSYIQSKKERRLATHFGESQLTEKQKKNNEAEVTSVLS